MSWRTQQMLEQQYEDARDEIARLRLTDAERAAVTACVEICESQALSAHEGRSLDAFARWLQKAATLRGLLERTK